jgi:hypothetical protein
MEESHMSAIFYLLEVDYFEWRPWGFYISSPDFKEILCPRCCYMDVLNSLVNYAVEMNLLQPHAVQGAKHRVSFYANDEVVFLRP